MKPALSYQEYKAPDSWSQILHGEQILLHINQRMKPWLEKIFGYHFLKLGGLSAEIDTSNCSINHQICLGTTQERVGIIADIDELPLIEQAVDGVLLAHAFEFSPDPHHLLREAHRVLQSDGYLIVTGFNPLSLIGCLKLVKFNTTNYPWKGRFFSPARIKDWLHLLGFEVITDERFIFSTLSRQKSLVNQRYWQSFLEYYLPNLGSVYLLVAKKRSLPLTPIKLRWQMRPQFRPVVN